MFVLLFVSCFLELALMWPHQSRAKFDDLWSCIDMVNALPVAEPLLSIYALITVAGSGSLSIRMQRS